MQSCDVTLRMIRRGELWHSNFLQEKYQHEFIPASPCIHAVLVTRNEPASWHSRKFPYLSPYTHQPDLSTVV